MILYSKSFNCYRCSSKRSQSIRMETWDAPCPGLLSSSWLVPLASLPPFSCFTTLVLSSSCEEAKQCLGNLIHQKISVTNMKEQTGELSVWSETYFVFSSTDACLMWLTLKSIDKIEIRERKQKQKTSKNTFKEISSFNNYCKIFLILNQSLTFSFFSQWL